MPVHFEYVIDGDTIKVSSNNSTYSVRFYGIDCFESKPNERSLKQAQSFYISQDEIICKGVNAREILKNKIGYDEILYLDVKGVDHYGRMVAVPYKRVLYIFKINLSKYMLKSGLCSTYIWKGFKK